MKKLFAIFILIVLIFPATACRETSEKRASYQINAKLNEDMTLSLNMTYEFYKENDGLKDKVCFSLYPNAFRENAKIKPLYANYYQTAYPNGASYGEISVLKVLLNGKVVKYQINGVDQNVLTVESGDFYLNKKNVLYMECKVVIPNVLHRFGYGDNTINLTSFYPIALVSDGESFYENVYYPSGDPFYSECADYTVSLTVPSEYVVASSLSPTKTECFGFSTKYSFERDKVRDIAFVLSKDFKIIKQDSQNASVYYYYLDDKTPEKSIQTAVDSLDYFSNNFCEYPYSEYVVCEADFIYGGMEYPCLTFIDKTLENEDRDYCIAHETAHQWWYGIIGVNESENGYIDEGLTEYSTVKFLSETSGYNVDKNSEIIKVKNTYAQIRKAVALSGGDSLPKMDRCLKDFSSDMDYVSIAYYRSQIAFFKLEEYMGKSKFNKFIKKLLSEYSYKNLDTQNLLKICKSVKSGSERFLKGYIDGVTAIS